MFNSKLLMARSNTALNNCISEWLKNNSIKPISIVVNKETNYVYAYILYEDVI